MLLVSLGHRLRNRRKELGLTQLELAKKAGVSHRFLTEVERGRSNISIERLAELTAALQIPLSEIFRGIGVNGQRMIALVGLRGAGKTTIGKATAEILGIDFVELDQLVVKEARMALQEIFALGGVSLYREFESVALQKLFRVGKSLVLATGGSIVTDVQNWTRIRDYATTVWLQASPEIYLKRVYEQGDWRPMRGFDNSLAEIQKLLQEREVLYAQATHTIETTELSIAEAVKKLVDYYHSH